MRDLLAPPFVLIGTVEEIASKLIAARDRWGLVRYTVRAAAIDDIVEVMATLGSKEELAPPESQWSGSKGSRSV